MVLSVTGLAVERGGRLLFRDLSFSVAPGEVLAVQGRNGSIIRMIIANNNIQMSVVVEVIGDY